MNVQMNKFFFKERKRKHIFLNIYERECERVIFSTH